MEIERDYNIALVIEGEHIREKIEDREALKDEEIKGVNNFLKQEN